MGFSPGGHGGVKPKNMELIFYCFSAKHAALRSKHKVLLTRNQDIMFEWSD